MSPRYKVIARNHLIKTYACNGDRRILTSTPIAGAIKENVRLENYHRIGTERENIAEFNLTKRTLKGRDTSVLNSAKYQLIEMYGHNDKYIKPTSYAIISI